MLGIRKVVHSIYYSIAVKVEHNWYIANCFYMYPPLYNKIMRCRNRVYFGPFNVDNYQRDLILKT